MYRVKSVTLSVQKLEQVIVVNFSSVVVVFVLVGLLLVFPFRNWIVIVCLFL